MSGNINADVEQFRKLAEIENSVHVLEHDAMAVEGVLFSLNSKTHALLR